MDGAAKERVCPHGEQGCGGHMMEACSTFQAVHNESGLGEESPLVHQGCFVDPGRRPGP